MVRAATISQVARRRGATVGMSGYIRSANDGDDVDDASEITGVRNALRRTSRNIYREIEQSRASERPINAPCNR